jgi:hypothetical protein
MSVRKTSCIASNLLIASLLLGCTGGGDEATPVVPPATGPTVAELAGTWSGAFRANAATVYHPQFTVTINSNGQITAITGGPVSGLTGTVVKVRDNVFGFTLSDGTEGGFMVDAGVLHAGFLDEDGGFGALQKNAGPLVNYAASDINGTWSGYTVELDGNFDLEKYGTSNATVAIPQATGSNFNGTFTVVNMGLLQTGTFGYYYGTWAAASGSGPMRANLTRDKNFAASWACASSPADYSNCSFSIWNKQ